MSLLKIEIFFGIIALASASGEKKLDLSKEITEESARWFCGYNGPNRICLQLQSTEWDGKNTALHVIINLISIRQEIKSTRNRSSTASMRRERLSRLSESGLPT